MAATKTRRKARTDTQKFADAFDAMVDNIAIVIKGKDDVIRRALTALLANGHVLFEDMPGTGKTMLARAIAATIDADNKRIQCTPDLLPADITGSAVLDRKTGNFKFRPGPVFTNVFLVDEVNRTSPKTQSALLESMQERAVSYEGATYELPNPFFVIATMNPIELAGTFPLPEAQLDRFLFKLTVGYASREAEIEMLKANQSAEAIDSLGAVISIEEVVQLIDWAKGVTVSDAVLGYITDICQATRTEPSLSMGGSGRAALALMRASRVMAATQGRDDVLPDDVKQLVEPVLSHRILLSADAQLREETVTDVIDRIVHRVKVPMGI